MKKSPAVIPALVLFFMLTCSVAFASSLYEQGMLAYRGGNYKLASALLENYLKDHPTAEGYYLLGYSYYKLGRKKDAMVNFDQAYLLDPEFKPEVLNKEINTGGK
ncbi:MAG: tetratricopeptide repeat protein [Actinomycetota bacterium]|nr:tetratricopeptide repeat protein [Actinomycetota bacterium]